MPDVLVILPATRAGSPWNRCFCRESCRLRFGPGQGPVASLGSIGLRPGRGTLGPAMTGSSVTPCEVLGHF